MSTETTPNVRKFLDLSTSHLPKAVFADLSSTDGVTIYELELDPGAFVWVPDDIDKHVAGSVDDVPTELVAVWRYARELGCDYVLLDGDGPTDPNLPRWDW